MIILDTHVLLWLDSGQAQLGPGARQLIEAKWRLGQVGVSAITFWEAALLQDRGRIDLPLAPDAWRGELLGAGLQEIEVSGRISMHAVALSDLHRDPADRIILSTAILAGATLVTADSRILTWSGEVERADAQR